MNSDSLQSLVQAHGHADPKVLLDQVMAGHRWDEALTIADHWSVVISPADVLERLARRLPTPWAIRLPVSGLFNTSPRRLWAAPAYIDRWVVALLEAGAPVATPCAGTVSPMGSDQTVAWSGNVWAFSIIAHLPQTLTYLRAHKPCVPDWHRQPVQWNGNPSTLLHLAVSLDRWDMAKTLMDEGYSPILPDAQGALPWEKMTPAAPDSQTLILDTLNMWPPSQKDLDAGWKRRGLAQGAARVHDQAWRAAMVTRMASGTDLQVITAIQDMLRLKQSSYERTIDLTPSVYQAWTSLPPDQKSIIHPIRTGPVKGRWSLNLAAAFVSVCSGTAGTREPVPPGSLVRNGDGSSHQTSDKHTTTHLQVWSKTLPHMTSQEMSQEILSRRLAGTKFILTGESLRSLAELMHDCKNGLGAPDHHPVDSLFQTRPLTPGQARAAFTALFVIRPLVVESQRGYLDKMARSLLIHPSSANAAALGQAQERWHEAALSAFTPVERYKFMVILEQEPKTELRTNQVLGLITTLVGRLPDPERPLTSEEHTLGQGFWAALASAELGNSSSWRALDEILTERGRPLFSTLVKWGFVPTPEQVEATLVNLVKNRSKIRAHFEAEVRAWQTPALSSPSSPPRSRIRP